MAKGSPDTNRSGLSSQLDALSRNLLHAARLLRRSPVFTLTAVATLALCIGANTAVFSIVDALILRPPPYPAPERLGEIATAIDYDGGRELEIPRSSLLALQILRGHASMLDCAAVSTASTGINVVIRDVAGYARQRRITGGFFGVLGVHPAFGRDFAADEGERGGAPVVILSDGFWRRGLQGDRRVLGRSLLLGGRPHTIVGVMPPGFERGFQTDLWMPLRPDAEDVTYDLVVRLRPAVTWSQAEGQVRALAAAALADVHPQVGTLSLAVLPLEREVARRLRRPLLFLQAAVGVVLLIGCLNLAGLQLARAGARSREIATRMALGGGRLAVVGQLMCESVLLASLGGAGGIALGVLGVGALRHLAAGSRFDLLDGPPVGLDLRTLALAAALALSTAVLFGLAPALRLAASDLRSALAAASAPTAARTPRRWPRRLLVVAEVALGALLLIVAGLLVRSLSYLWHLAPGFDGRDVVAARVSLADARYASGRRINELFSSSLERLLDVPGVQAAAVGLGLPYERGLRVVFTPLAGADLQGRGNPTGITGLTYVTPSYFSTLRITLLRGRTFDARDVRGSMPVAVVNRALERRYFSGRPAPGHGLRILGVRREIVGTVGDVLQKVGLAPDAPLEDAPALYLPAAQAPDALFEVAHAADSPAWIVRLSGPRKPVLGRLQRTLRALDHALPFSSFQSLEQARSISLGAQRFQAMLLAAFAGLALLLAAIGLYGLIAQTVVERTRELGIRLALGATVAGTVVTVALPGMLLALLGAALGMVLAALASSFMAHFLTGVAPSDPLTYGAVSALLATVAAGASALPALRVAAIDPVESLRE
jgi:predicted permease